VKVGVIGVGAMGMGIAKALLARGFAVTVRDIVPERQAEAVAAGAKGVDSPAQMAGAVDLVVTVVVDAAQTREVVAGIGTPVMMCSTIAPSEAEDIARALGDVPMLDAPISGGPARAHAGTLSVMASGSDAAFDRSRPVLDAIAARVFRISERPGDGSRMKVVNNMLAAANLAAGCEAMAMASRLGLPLPQVLDVVNASSGGSCIFADRMARALQGDYSPRAATRVLLKDVGLFVREARNLGLTAPMAECAREIFHDAVAAGFAEEDDAAVLKRYAARWGAEIP
jgi:3-hydroxyisobutyrate dehydrogenase-like beta-hydroxyacid dehydrogenase